MADAGIHIAAVTGTRASGGGHFDDELAGLI
jgi:hypothetical protein